MKGKTQKKIFFVLYDKPNYGDTLLREYFFNKYSKGNNIFFLNKKNLILSLYNLIISDDIFFIGGIFQDISSIKSFIFYFSLLVLSYLLKKKIYLYSSTFEIKSKIFRNIFINTLIKIDRKKQLEHIIVRDLQSYKIIEKLNCLKNIEKDPFDTIYNIENKSIIFVENFLKDNIFNKDLINLFVAINKSYYKIKNKKNLENLILNSKNLFNSIFIIISDPQDYNLIYKKFIQNQISNLHLIKVSNQNINSLIKLIKSVENKVMYCERLHLFLSLKNYIDIFIINSKKVENYIKTWYEKKD